MEADRKRANLVGDFLGTRGVDHHRGGRDQASPDRLENSSTDFGVVTQIIGIDD